MADFDGDYFSDGGVREAGEDPWSDAIHPIACHDVSPPVGRVFS